MVCFHPPYLLILQPVENIVRYLLDLLGCIICQKRFQVIRLEESHYLGFETA